MKGMQYRILTLEQDMDASMVGWKFSRLKTLYSGGIRVPGFFCLTKYFYEAAVAEIRKDIAGRLKEADFDDYESVSRASADVRGMILGTEITQPDREMILDQFDRTFGEDGIVSVRSSTVGMKLEESEDSADNPFAGMSDSFLYVRREQLMTMVKKCWASGFNTESLLYRQRQGMDLCGFGVAVGIQQMVFGERSFVMFTCNPNTLSKDAVLAAGYGIGEGVVQEKVEADHYFVNYYDGKIKKNVVKKTTQVTFDKEAGEGIRLEQVEEGSQELPCLSDGLILEAVAAGRKIEDIFGCPQDIEGTVTPDGRIYILQSRPVSLDGGKKIIWTNSNITESFPGVTTVLTYTFARYFYRVIFYDFYKRMGTPQEVLHDSWDELDHMIGFLKGRVYYSLSSFYYLHSLTSTFKIWRHTWEKMIGIDTSFETPLYHSADAPEGKRMGEKQDKQGWDSLERIRQNHGSDMKEFHEWWERLFSPLRGKTFVGEDPVKLVRLFEMVWQEVGNHWGVTLNNDVLIQLAYEDIEQNLKLWGISDDNLISGMLCGEDNLMSVEIILSAVRLAELVQKSPELMSEFSLRSPEELWENIRTHRYPQGFTEAFQNHLYWYGDRGLQELKVEKPNLRQTPWVLAGSVKDYAAAGMNVEKFMSHEKQVRRETEERLEEMLSLYPDRLKTIKGQFENLRNVIRYRENSRYCRSELYGFSKNIFFAIGRWMEENNVLECREDIVHLSMEELFGFINGMGTDQNLKGLVSLRKAEFEENEKEDLPMVLTTNGPVYSNPVTVKKEQIDDTGLMQGLGSSYGKVRGIARIVIDPGEYKKDDQDTILIAKETDPGWLFLMLSAKGIVVERGSMLSHTAITGRKFGIPTVVAVDAATRRIPDGALVEIDGGAGTVEVISRPDER